MRLFSATWCGYCKPVKAYVAQKRKDVEVVNIDTLSTEEINKLSLQQIPALQKEDGTIMYESKDILKYLGSK